MFQQTLNALQIFSACNNKNTWQGRSNEHIPATPGWALGKGLQSKTTHLWLLDTGEGIVFQCKTSATYSFPQELPSVASLNREQGSSFSKLRLYNVLLSRANRKHFVSYNDKAKRQSEFFPCFLAGSCIHSGVTKKLSGGREERLEGLLWVKPKLWVTPKL